jgi:hypothetical protein
VEVTKTKETPPKTSRTEYKTQKSNPETIPRDDTAPPDTRYITSSRTVQRESAFEKFLNRIFPEQLSYVLNPYTFFLILVLSVLPIIGIFIYLIVYYLR